MMAKINFYLILVCIIVFSISFVSADESDDTSIINYNNSTAQNYSFPNETLNFSDNNSENETNNLTQEINDTLQIPTETDYSANESDKTFSPKTINFFLNALAQSVNYITNMYTLSLQGFLVKGDIYDGRSLLTAQGTTANAVGSTYQANVGFFGKFTTQKQAGTGFYVTINGTEKVTGGQTYSLNIEIKDSLGSYINSSVPKVTLYDPLKNRIVEDVSATLISTGKYQYDFMTSPTQTTGQWETNISINNNNILNGYSDLWELVNNPTQLKINSVSTAASPSITADTLVTNEGGVDYEYSYEYCIVPQASSQCAGSDVISRATGSKLINAGESWNTQLTLSVNQQGTYWFKVIFYYNDKKSGASQLFSVGELPSTSSGTGSTGGGSSGGGIAIPSAGQINTTLSDEINDKKIEENQSMGDEGIICNSPYIRNGAECCLDVDDNLICDKDEDSGGSLFKKITGLFVTNLGNSSNKINFVNILLLILFIAIMFSIIFLAKRLWVSFQKKSKKYGSLITEVIGLKAITSEGIELGKVTDIYLDKNSIQSIKIKTSKKNKNKKKGITISYKQVLGISDIVLIDHRVTESF